MYCYDCMKEIQDGSPFCRYCGSPVRVDDCAHHLRPGTVLHNQYLAGNSIGEGGFGITYVGLDLSLDMKIAIKEYYPSGFANRNNTLSNSVTLNYSKDSEYYKNGVESFLREAKNIAKFNNESGIVDVRAFFEENDTAYIIMEYLDGENLSEKIRRDGKLDAKYVFTRFLPMMNTLEKMHSQNIIHRDISPDNIRILPEGSLKLMDFGSARYFAGMDKKTMSVQYKPGYAPIEQFNKNGNHGPWTDVYGLCATIYKCVTGVTPVDSLERCQSDSLKAPSELGVDIPKALEQVLMYGLAIYPENRCQSMSELIRITENALNGSYDRVSSFSGNAVPDSIYSTKAADEQYKTMFADKTYGDNYAGNAPGGSYGVNTQNRQQGSTAENRPSNRKKPVALIVILSVLGALAISAVVIFALINPFKDSKTDEQETTSTQAVTQKQASESSAEMQSNDNSATVTVPDVSGKKAEEAANELAELGIEVETVYEESSEVPADCVIKQSIQPEREINVGNTVILVIAKAPDNQTSVDYEPDVKVNDASYFSGASASSVLPDQQGINYSPYNVLNSDPTCWVEGASGHGVGEWIKLDLPSAQRISDLRIINGYAGTRDQYNNNAKIKKIKIEFSDGQSTTADLRVFPTSDRYTVQTVTFSQPVVTEFVKLTILDYEKGELFEDTCLTYVAPN